METILLIAVVGTLIIVAFFIGARVGQKVVKNEPIELPNINPLNIPLNIVSNYEQKREEEKIQKDYRDNLEAINNYDGNI